DYWAYKEQNHTLEGFAAYSRDESLVKVGNEVERVHSLDMTHDLAAVLGMQPLMGRMITAEEEPPTAEAQTQASYHVALVGWNFWQRRLGADPNVLGRTIKVNNWSYTIVGVMPREFNFPVDWETDLVLPLGVSRDPQMQGARFLDTVGRLRPGVTVAEAQADLEVIASRQKPIQWKIVAAGLEDTLVRSVRTSLWMLAGAVGFVLLIVAANLASLALSRVTARQNEAAVRLALGAGRWRLARGMMAEAVLLAMLGAAAGLAMAQFALKALLVIAPADLPRLHEVAINAPVIAFTVLAALLTGVLLGAVPAWRAGKTQLNQAMKEGGPTLAGTRTRLQSAIVGFEVVLAVVLLVGAGLMIRTMAKVRAVDPGFDSHGVLTAEIVLPPTTYPKMEQQRAFAQRLLGRIQELPGVEAASGATGLPMSGTRMTFNLTFTDDKTGGVSKSIIAFFHSVSPGYFAALRAPIIAGRDFTAADDDSALPVGIANESLVKTMWPNENPIGKKMPNGFTKKEVTIVGVVKDGRYDSLDRAPRPELYVPFAQRPFGWLRLAVRVKGQQDPMALAAAVNQQLRAVDSELTLDKTRTLDEVLRNSTAERNFYMLLLTLFAALALALAAVGVFGVISYAVTQRTHEIGVRIALGADARQIVAMVLRRGLAPAIAGLAVGLACAAGLNRVLRNLLFGVSGTDPLTFAAVALVLIAAAVAACYVPARRASRVDPMRALHYE
ncbi:MAG TPA: ABC transporter permease, partial [Terriglobales bacterium]|nr:ABC transporter permease [Terriglobales bacterium]